MKFSGQFRSILENKLYTAEIITRNDSSQTREITLGPDPFITEMDSNSDTIYTPVKYSKATVQIVADEYYTEMYSSTAAQNKVTLYDASSNVVWAGYTEPNIFSAPFNFPTETYDIEAYDGLSTLKYYDYEVVDTSTGKDFVTFWQIVDKILAKAGCYNGFRFSLNTKIPGNSSCLLADCIISEQNFFDEDDKPMKMNEVLEEICKFCGVTAVAVGTFVYFLDYDALKHDVNSYQTYQIGSFYNSEITVNSYHTVSAQSYKATGSNLSMDNTYNKVTVKDSLYTVESILPPMFNNEDLTNVITNNFLHTYGFTTGANLCHDGKKYFDVTYRSYTNNNYTNTYWNNNGTRYSGTPVINALTAGDYLCAGFFKFNVKTGDSESAAKAGKKYNSWTNYLMLTVNGIRNYTDGSDYEVLSSNDNFSKPFFMSSNAKYLVKGSMILQDNRGYLKNQSNGTAHYGYFPTTELESGYQGNF